MISIIHNKGHIDGIQVSFLEYFASKWELVELNYQNVHINTPGNRSCKYNIFLEICYCCGVSIYLLVLHLERRGYGPRVRLNVGFLIVIIVWIVWLLMQPACLVFSTVLQRACVIPFLSHSPSPSLQFLFQNQESHIECPICNVQCPQERRTNYY